MIDRLGLKVGDYLLERELGRGAFGTVYQARNEKTQARVAIKLERAVAEGGVGRSVKAARNPVE